LSTYENKIRELVKDEGLAKEILQVLSEEITANGEKTALNFAENNCCFFLKTQTYKNDGKVEISFSPSVKNVTGYTAEELSQMPAGLNSLIIKEDILKIKKFQTELKENPDNNFTTINYRIKTKNEEVIWLREILSRVFDETGKIKKVESALFNISDFIERESNLVKLQEQYKQKNAAKDKFISIVSHDLRSPFTSLLGFSEILLKESDLPEGERREYLEYIYDAAKSELELINDLLDWSRLQTGKIKIQAQRINLKSAVSAAISVLTGNAIRKDIEIKTNVPDKLFVLADERLLHESVKNLIANSIKFTPRGKKIYVSGNKFKEGVIELVIRDEGIGIPEKEQHKIFRLDEKFTLDGTEGEKGSGLGLALVKEIIDKHNGNIWFYSKENEGTEFHITLPEAKNKILIVEDDAESRRIIRRLVLKYLIDSDIIEASNGYEALTQIEQGLPALLITDHEMPLMNGKQLIEALQKKITKNIPVIIISGKLNQELKKDYTKMGVAEILTKPIDQELLNKTLERLFLKSE
jgi:two-component system sensor histidine kinase/response regulator